MKNKSKNNTCCCKCCGCQSKDSSLGAIIKYKPEITYNNTRTYPTGKKAPDGIEIRFGATRPTVEVREMLKAHGFKFSEKQTIWYAIDNAKSREMAAYFEANEIDADDTQYEKRNFWAKIKSFDYYKKLGNYTEFMIKGTPPLFFRNKKQLEFQHSDAKGLIYTGKLSFKKFYNKVVGEEDGEAGQAEEELEEELEAEETGEESEDQKEQDEEDGVRPDPFQPYVISAIGEKLYVLAQGLQKQIDAKINSGVSRQRPTARRMRMAAGMRQDGYHLKNIQDVLFALAKAHKYGLIKGFPLLTQIKNKTQVDLLNRFNNVHGQREEESFLQSIFKRNTAAFEQLGIKTFKDWEQAIAQRDKLLSNMNHELSHQRNEETERLHELEMQIKSMKIPGFFPTPKHIIQTLIRFAELKESDAILEPSAGKGDILDAITEHFGDVKPDLDAIEINPKLRELLEYKGYNLVGNNFLETDDQGYDKIIMNPPFENGLDIEHVTHSLKMLKHGGRVVAVMSEGVFFRKFKKEEAFRELLSEHNAYVSETISDAFVDAFNSTKVRVRIVVINEDGTYPEIVDQDTQDEYQTNNEMEDLELEAKAQLELLKMKIKLKLKGGGLNGVPKINNDKLNYLRQKAREINLMPAVWDFK